MFPRASHQPPHHSLSSFDSVFWCHHLPWKRRTHIWTSTQCERKWDSSDQVTFFYPSKVCGYRCDEHCCDTFLLEPSLKFSVKCTTVVLPLDRPRQERICCPGASMSLGRLKPPSLVHGLSLLRWPWVCTHYCSLGAPDQPFHFRDTQSFLTITIRP